jgi:hypothetical protein
MGTITSVLFLSGKRRGVEGRGRGPEEEGVRHSKAALVLFLIWLWAMQHLLRDRCT